MDIASLRAFLAVAETGSFSSAGERLHLTQPAVSKRVAALESALGRRLFDRVGRQVGLTEAGATLLPRARTILDQVSATQRELADLSGRVAGRLTVGTSHHIGLHHLPPVLRAFSARYWQVELDLQFLASERACEAVARGELELGIVTLPLQPGPPLASRELWPDPMVPVCGPDHPLAALPQPQPAELLNHAAILPGAETFTRHLIETAFTPYGGPPRSRLSTNYLETIKMMVSVGLGWSVLPRSMVDGDLVPLDCPGLAIRRALGVVQHRQRSLSNAGRAFLEALAQDAAIGS